MRFYLALAIFFLCHSGASIYASKLREIKKLGSVSYWHYEGHSSFYAIYKTEWAKACYLNDEIYLPCEEIL